MLFTSTTPASYHASINRKSGPRVVGHIDRSDETLRFITTQDDERYTIERSDILAIDHPGKLSMGIGGGLMAFSLGIFTWPFQMAFTLRHKANSTTICNQQRWIFNLLEQVL